MFYAYDNHPNRRVTIHEADCPDCNYGSDKNGTGPTRNGKWTHRFATVAEVRATVAGVEPTVRLCGNCRPSLRFDLARLKLRFRLDLLPGRVLGPVFGLLALRLDPGNGSVGGSLKTI